MGCTEKSQIDALTTFLLFSVTFCVISVIPLTWICPPVLCDLATGVVFQGISFSVCREILNKKSAILCLCDLPETTLSHSQHLLQMCKCQKLSRWVRLYSACVRAPEIILTVCVCYLTTVNLSKSKVYHCLPIQWTQGKTHALWVYLLFFICLVKWIHQQRGQMWSM